MQKENKIKIGDLVCWVADKDAAENGLYCEGEKVYGYVVEIVKESKNTFILGIKWCDEKTIRFHNMRNTSNSKRISFL